MKVPDTGGEPVLIAAIDEGLKENSLRNPQFLADGNHFLYFARTLDPHNHAIYIDALDTVGKAPRHKLLVSDGAAEFGHDPFSNRDYVVFPKDGQLWAQRLDQSKGSISGEKVAVSDDVGQFSLSRTGTLVFRRAGSEQNSLQWVDRLGKPSRQVGKPGDYWDVSLAPDERHAAVQNHRAAEGRFWIETIDLASNVQSTLSDPAGRSEGLVWGPDSQTLSFSVWGDGKSRILRQRLDSAAAAEVLYSLPERYDLRSATPDGKTLVADRWDGDNRQGLIFSEANPPSWRRFDEPSATVVRGQFSPDGRWLAYEARGAGTPEIYITDFPKLTSRKRISPAGGSEPRWGRDGKQLFFVSASGFLTNVTVADGSATSNPSPLFRFPGQVAGAGGFSYDVSRDGKNFLVTDRTPPAEARDLSVVFNWPQLMGGQSR